MGGPKPGLRLAQQSFRWYHVDVQLGHVRKLVRHQTGVVRRNAAVGQKSGSIQEEPALFALPARSREAKDDIFCALFGAAVVAVVAVVAYKATSIERAVEPAVANIE